MGYLRLFESIMIYRYTQMFCRDYKAYGELSSVFDIPL